MSLSGASPCVSRGVLANALRVLVLIYAPTGHPQRLRSLVATLQHGSVSPRKRIAKQALGYSNQAATWPIPLRIPRPHLIIIYLNRA